MKQFLFIFSLLVFSLSISGQSHKYRVYPFNSNERDIHLGSKDSTLFLAPAVTIDAFTLNLSTGEYEIGAIPGVGYGIRWNPYKWESNYLIGLDVFMKASLNGTDNPNYFGIQVSPAITIINWFTIGYGPEFRLGLGEVPNKTVWLFRFGISKSL
jgi:hypothetical protein